MKGAKNMAKTKNKSKEKKEEYVTPRNEFHFYLQQTAKASIQKDKKKTIPRKQKYKETY